VFTPNGTKIVSDVTLKKRLTIDFYELSKGCSAYLTIYGFTRGVMAAQFSSVTWAVTLGGLVPPPATREAPQGPPCATPSVGLARFISFRKAFRSFSAWGPTLSPRKTKTSSILTPAVSSASSISSNRLRKASLNSYKTPLLQGLDTVDRLEHLILGRSQSRYA